MSSTSILFLTVRCVSREVRPVCQRLVELDVISLFFTSLSGHSWPLFTEFNTLLIRDTEERKKKDREEGERERKKDGGGGRECLWVKGRGRRGVSVIAPISTYLQRATCFTDWRDIITSEETRGGERRYSNLLSGQYRFSSPWHEMFIDVSPEILKF